MNGIAAFTTAEHLVTLAALTCGLLALALTSGRGWRWRDRASWSVAAAAAVLIAWRWWVAVVTQPVVAPWDGPRLAATLAIRQGWALYGLPDRGPVLGWIYPPVSALFYLPATLASDPTAMILAGRVLSLLFCCGPITWLLVREVRAGHWPGAVSALLFVLFALRTTVSPALGYVATSIVADAPAIALGALSLGLLSHRRLGWAILAAWLAVWSKQLAAPLVIVPLFWALATGGRRLCLRALGLTIALGLVVSLPLTLTFGPRELWFNLVEVPGAHPWRVSSWLALRQELTRALEPELGVLVPLSCGLAAALARALAWHRGVPKLRAGEGWPLFLIAAGMELPLAVMGYVKEGGDVNSLAHFLAPLTVASLLLLGRWAACTPRACWCLLVLTGYAAVSAWPAFEAGPRQAGIAWIDEQRQVLKVLRAEPGAVYFPCHPLEHLASDGRLFHYEYGVFDRDKAGWPLSPEHLRAGMPPRARWICYPAHRTYAQLFLARALPEFQPSWEPHPSLPEGLWLARPPAPPPP